MCLLCANEREDHRTEKNYFDKGDVFEGDGGKTINLSYSDIQAALNCRCVGCYRSSKPKSRWAAS